MRRILKGDSNIDLLTNNKQTSNYITLRQITALKYKYKTLQK